MIRAVKNKDAAELAEIYNFYVTDTVVTFEDEPITAETMLERIQQMETLNLPWLVAENESGEVIGYAYAAKWRQRITVQGAVEVSVYLSPSAKGRGLGTKLYQALFTALKANGVRTVIGAITLPNEVSVALHKKLGMEQVANFKQVGYKFDQWLDLGFWQGSL